MTDNNNKIMKSLLEQSLEMKEILRQTPVEKLASISDTLDKIVLEDSNKRQKRLKQNETREKS